jgi:hypothetical protein
MKIVLLIFTACLLFVGMTVANSSLKEYRASNEKFSVVRSERSAGYAKMAVECARNPATYSFCPTE